MSPEIDISSGISLGESSSSSVASFPTFEFQKAVDVMCFVPKRCNDMMNVGRLQGFEVNSEDRCLVGDS